MSRRHLECGGFARRLAIGAVASICVSFAVPFVNVTLASAQQVTIEFRTALQPYGRWHRSHRWGEVWIPAHVRRHWRPYTVGHWVYTDDWGWYWVTDKPEADWGWVTYHYGRWVLDRDLGWVWVPGKEWAPAWVVWRRGHEHIGWAPLPPREILTEYRDEPNVWIFVRARDFTAPEITRVVVPEPRVTTYIHDTVIVNRTVAVRERGSGFAVNPGIEPSVVSAVVGQPLHTYSVRPHVLAGTARIPNAVEVQASDLQQGHRSPMQVSVQQTQTTVKATKQVPKPQPLAANSKGRLGQHPPRAAQQAAQQKPGTPASQGQAAQKQAPQTTGKGTPQAQPQTQAPSAQKQQPAGQQQHGHAAERGAGKGPSSQGHATAHHRGKAATRQAPETNGQAAPQKATPQKTEPPSTAHAPSRTSQPGAISTHGHSRGNAARTQPSAPHAATRHGPSATTGQAPAAAKHKSPAAHAPQQSHHNAAPSHETTGQAPPSVRGPAQAPAAPSRKSPQAAQAPHAAGPAHATVGAAPGHAVRGHGPGDAGPARGHGPSKKPRHKPAHTEGAGPSAAPGGGPPQH